MFIHRVPLSYPTEETGELMLKNISKLQTPNATNVAKGFPKPQIGTEDFPRNRGRLDLLADLIIFGWEGHSLAPQSL